MILCFFLAKEILSPAINTKQSCAKLFPKTILHKTNNKIEHKLKYCCFFPSRSFSKKTYRRHRESAINATKRSIDEPIMLIIVFPLFSSKHPFYFFSFFFSSSVPQLAPKNPYIFKKNFLQSLKKVSPCGDTSKRICYTKCVVSLLH